MTSSESQNQINAFLAALGIERPVFWKIAEGGHVKLATETLHQPNVEDSKRLGLGVFITPNELGDVWNDKHNLRHEANVIRFTSVFVDMDSGEPHDQIERLKRFHLPPSIVIRTGRGHHAYWILDRFESITPDTWRSVQKAMAYLLHGDRAATDPARLMRLPGSWHVKHEPREVKILLLDPDKIYSLDEFPEYETYSKTHSPPPSDRRISRGLPDIRPPRPRVLTAGERHTALLYEAGRLFRGAAPSDIERLRAILKSWYSQSCQPLKPNWEYEVDSLIDGWLLKKEFGQK